ncbi:MAG: YbjQ family protein [Bacteroidetes bacterium]|nr:YbjQ family protein [Bacteroidota bacterium]MBU2585785.1 YbjQ family protein [Bacteroidota bacterium]
MIVVSSSNIAGYKIVKTFETVRGNTVRARHLGKDILAGLKGMVGGEIEEYTKLMAESRDQSVDRMIAKATELGANAIVDTRFTTSMIMSLAAEMLVFGTAVLIEKE